MQRASLTPIDLIRRDVCTPLFIIA